MNQLTVVFMGSEEFSLPILHSLATADNPAHTRVAGVVTQPDRPAGRGRKLSPNPVKAYAQSAGIPTLQPERLRAEDARAAVLALRPDLIVVASYGQILPRAILEAPRFGSLNLHPSLLPLYRGASPVASPILCGDEETGVTLMLMVPRMDAGPILAQERTLIGPSETAGELEARLAAMSAALLDRSLPAWIQGRLPAREQDESQATYTARFEKADGSIDWNLPAGMLVRRVRAFNPWPGAHTYWRGRMLKLLRARELQGEASPGEVVGSSDAPLVVGTGHGLLAIEEAQLAGGKPIPARELLHGHPGLIGSTLSGTP